MPLFLADELPSYEHDPQATRQRVNATFENLTSNQPKSLSHSPEQYLGNSARHVAVVHTKRMIELMASAVSLARTGQGLASAILFRAMLENTAYVYHFVFQLGDKTGSAIKEQSLAELRIFLKRRNLGSSHADILAEIDPDETKQLKAVNVKTLIERLAKDAPVVADQYKWLSELTHPNGLTIGALYSKQTLDGVDYEDSELDTGRGYCIDQCYRAAELLEVLSRSIMNIEQSARLIDRIEPQ